MCSLMTDRQTLLSPRLPATGSISVVNLLARRHLDSAALVVGTVVSGLAVYAVSIVGIRTYGSAEFAPISVLWTLWAVFVAVLTFPIQHWIIHRMARDASEDAVAAAVPRIVLAGAGLAILLGACSWLAGTRLFGEQRVVWSVLTALLVIGATLTGVVRGVLAGRRKFGSVAAFIAAENILRLVACGVVVAAGGSVEAFGLALVAGAACVAAWPGAFRLVASDRAVPPPVASFIGGLGTGNILAQVVLTAGPVVLSAMGAEAAEVTALFVTMALFRAPYVVALGLSVKLTGPVTERAAAGDRAALRRLVGRTSGAAVVSACLAVPIALAIGTQLVDFVYGQSAAPSSRVVALVAAGSVLALGTLALTVILAAQTETARVAAAWAVAVVAAAVVIAVVPVDATMAVTLGFVTAEAVALIAMAAVRW
jgi:O-antigen/teichoic acid export membrane protein